MSEVNTLEKITEQIEQSRSHIAEILLEIDDILLQVNPQIQAEYETKIGYLETELLKWQIEARRERRRVNLAQARVNAGQQLENDEFNGQLDEELEDWYAKLEASKQRLLEALEQRGDSTPLPPMLAKELKKLHKLLIKRLHPDLHPGQSEDAERFFLAAQKAYEQGDVAALRAIAVATEGMNSESCELGTELEAYAELELVQAQERVTQERLDDIKASYPYMLKEKLENGAWVIERTNDLKEKIQQQKDAAAAYKKRYSELKEASDLGRQ